MPKEGHSLQFRAEAFNFPKITSVTSSNYGRITSTTNNMRQLKVALKYVF